ncbi:MAG TPA: carbon-nitrogen hydrolase family protein [Jiangellaceae bacterium]|nr:carbon-nitrogen hydrolase family protein [Jiangellaceae bacterium]
MRIFTAAAVQVKPVHERLTAETIKANVDHAVDYVERCVAASEAELVVLPEAVTTGFTPGCSAEELWDVLGEPDGGPTVAPLAETAGRLGVHLVWGTYSRGNERGVVHNSAVLAGPSGDVLGGYHKTHPFCTEVRSRGGWVTAGDDVCVVSTELGRIGLMVCFDGDFPELSRIMALKGAEVLARPSALLRSADIWELTNRARAYDNHVYVVGANAVGIDPGGLLYFGNSMIVTPTAEVLAWGSTHESWVSARLDPSVALSSLTPGSSVRQGFDHLAERNLGLLQRHADTLIGEGATSFPYQPAAAGE